MEKKVIKAYKGFNADLTCRDFQYEVGKEYEIKGDIECCYNGFHACQSPLDVFGYYLLDMDCNLARFCEVEQSGKIDSEQNGDTKVASSKIKIKAEIKFADFIKLGVEWIKEKVADKSADKKLISDNSGDYAQIGSSGNSAQIGSNGNSAQIGSNGNFAQIGSSGDYAQINSTGEDSVICCAGHNSIVKTKQGSWITLAEWEYNKEKDRSVPKNVVTKYVDGEEIKADTWYKLVDGVFTEVEP